MSHENPSWDDVPHDLMADWNPAGEDGPLSLSSGDSGLAVEHDLPSRLRRPWDEPEDDSIPKGSTALCRAFMLKPPDRGEADPAATPQGGEAGDEPPSSETPGPSAGGERGVADTSPGRLPRVGEEVKGFRLRLELGRGAFARVFLAEELNLGNRLVALKVSRAEGEEPRILARLQHPHVVPVHSVHDDPVTGLRLLCMPFLGGANLAQLLQEAWGLAPNHATGQSLVEALDQLSHRLPPAIGQEPSLGPARSRRVRPGSLSRLADAPVEVSAFRTGLSLRSGRYGSVRLGSLFSRLVHRGDRLPAAPDEVDHGQPSRRFLRGANGIQASVWIVAHLAQGLEHAHQRGLLHRDLKPANVLVAADGTPMLLDFNLAAETEVAQDGGEQIVRAMLGGTLPYMSPEHLDAFDPEGSTTPEQVDERSDLYALGLILFEMISGEHPFPEPPDGLAPVRAIRWMRDERRRRPVPSLRERCPDVPWSLDALVTQCLDPEPDRRYQSAHDLSEDLGRFLEDRPMRHCPEPSFRERAAKWARRHPMACSSTSIVAASLVLLTVLTLAAAAVYDGMLGLSARMQFQALEREFTDVQFLLNTAGRREENLKQGILRARSIVQREGIPDPVARLQSSAKLLPGASSRWIDRLTPEERLIANRDLIELLLLEARATVVLAEARGTDDEQRRALQRAVARLNQAEQLDAPVPAVLFMERAEYRRRLGDHPLAAADRERAGAVATQTSRDLTLLGTSLLESRDLAGAEAALRLALARDETSLWAWFVMGHCHFEQRRFTDAVADFTGAVACGPGHAWTHFNRGLALASAGRPIDAKLAYDRALELDPGLLEARVDRGVVELQLGRTKEALDDFQAAVDAGRRDLGTLAALGECLARLGRGAEAEARFGRLLERNPGDPMVRVARGIARLGRDPAGAEADFRAVLARDPRNARANYGMARLIRSTDPAAALAYLEKAVEGDPDDPDAIQLRALERARAGNRGALDDVDRLLRMPTAEHLYNAACALAIYGEKARDPTQLDRGLDALSQALRAGFAARAAESDPDLKPLSGRADFARLIERFRPPGRAGR